MLGNDLLQLPAWPVARAHLATRSERIERLWLRLGHAWEAQRWLQQYGQAILPPARGAGRLRAATATSATTPASTTTTTSGTTSARADAATDYDCRAHTIAHYYNDCNDYSGCAYYY